MATNYCSFFSWFSVPVWPKSTSIFSQRWSSLEEEKRWKNCQRSSWKVEGVLFILLLVSSLFYCFLFGLVPRNLIKTLPRYCLWLDYLCNRCHCFPGGTKVIAAHKHSNWMFERFTAELVVLKIMNQSRGESILHHMISCET